MINKFIWFLIVLTFFFVNPALTQTSSVDGYAIQHFTDENGLPQNSVNDMLFDVNGYLWLASQAGVARFNGSSFKLFYPNDKPAMESNIFLLGKDPGGCIYFETVDHRLYYYTGKNSPSLSPVDIRRQPKLLDAEKQLFDFTRFLHDPDDKGEASRRQAIFRELFDHNEFFFVADTAHIYFRYQDSLYYYDGRRILPLPVAPLAQCLMVGKELYVLRQDSVLAICEEGKKIGGPAPIEGDPRDKVTRSIRKNVDYRIFSSGGSIHLLAGTRLYRLYRESDGHLRSEFLIDLDFTHNISAIAYQARLDLLLVATTTEGFYFLRKDHFLVNGWPAALRQRLSDRLFGPLALLHGREILTDKFIFTPDGRSRPTKSSATGWRQCLYVDRQDHVWGDIDSLPVKMTTDLAPVTTWPPLDADIVDYQEDAGGNLYCLTRASLWRLDTVSGGAGRFRRLYTTDPAPDKGNNEVMEAVGPHRIWIGNGRGLVEYDPDTHSAHSIPELSGMHVRAIHCCRDSSILIGTYGQGYYYYTHRRFFPMPLDKNGFLVTAHCFLEDRKGNVWISCNKGLFKVPLADMDAWVNGVTDQLYYYYYGRQDGLLTNEFNGGFNASGVITPDDLMTLLSMKGLVSFYTDSLPIAFPQVPIDMTDLEIDGQPAPICDTIHLSRDYKSFMMELSCPYLGNRNNLYWQYNLKGLNDDWKQVPENGLLSFSRLAAGNYTLQVRKVNGFGKNNYQYRRWTILIPQAFYRATWFLAAIGLMILTLLGLLVQQRLKLIEKKKEVQQAHALTGRQREKLISLVIHDLRSPLRFLTMLASDLHDNQADLSPAEMKDRAWWIKKGAQDIYHFSDDFLLWITSQKDNFKLSKQLFPIEPLLREIYDFYLDQAQQKGNRIAYAAEEGLQVFTDPHLLITIIRNLVDNANKYTDNGAIRIEAKKDADGWMITVADTGKGMSPQQIAAFLGKGSLDTIRSGSQLGHQFIFDLTQRLGGVLSVESAEGKGTMVGVHIPGLSG